MYIIGGGCFKPTLSVIDVYKLDLRTLEVRTHASLGLFPSLNRRAMTLIIIPILHAYP